jgi:hypothetical protein
MATYNGFLEETRDEVEELKRRKDLTITTCHPLLLHYLGPVSHMILWPSIKIHTGFVNV